MSMRATHASTLRRDGGSRMRTHTHRSDQRSHAHTHTYTRRPAEPGGSAYVRYLYSGHSATALTMSRISLSRVCVCVPACSCLRSKFMTKRRVRGAWRWRSNVPGSRFPGVERAHQPGPRAARAWLVSCNREASRNFNRPGGSNPVENR